MNDEASVFYELAREFALNTNRNIFLTGKAGTGKTTFLHRLKELTQKQLAVVAPTGVAAIHAGGTTLHSFFQLPFTPFVPTPEGKKQLLEKMKMRSHRRKILEELELLVIDEISMVRADTLDAIDTILRHVRYRHREAFGGVQVLFIGDMFQLSPVVTNDDLPILAPYYANAYFFSSQVIRQTAPVYIELDKIFRQSNADFIRVLNEVRNNCLSQQSLQLLQSRYDPLFQPTHDDSFITLTTHNYKADRMNAEELSKLKGKTLSFKATIEGEFNEKSYPTDSQLELKIGARVMLIKNDTETPRRFYNGKIGVVKDVVDKAIIIQCQEDEHELEIFPMEWENIRYRVDERTKQIEEELIGKFTQYPLRLAWAITIHKSQGLTFEKAVIDAGEAFAPGQVYVALSRCRSLEGIVLRSRINPYSIENDRDIIAYDQHKLSVELLESELDRSRNQFREYLLRELFDYNPLRGQISRLIKSTETAASAFNDDTLPYLRNIGDQIAQLEEVGLRFSQQLRDIFSSISTDENYLADRLDAAIGFFQEKIDTLITLFRHSPAITDNKESAQEYNEAMKMLYSTLCMKRHLMKKLKHPFSVTEYFSNKQHFLLPDLQLNAYAQKSTAKNLKVKHPLLYYKLIDLRNRICEPDDTPIYLVAASKSIQEMADYLPQTEKELAQIHGFGKAKVDKFGKMFLEVINDYCMDHSLTSQMYEKSEKTKPKRKKKGES